MVRQSNITQQELLDAVDNTIAAWESLRKENLKGNLMCPLCALVKNTYKGTFQKGSARGTCLLCPVKHFNAFHICVGIGHVYSTSDMTDNEMKSLRGTVLTTLKDLSEHTGIQISRMHRILNGYEMKLSEYEKINDLINQNLKDREFKQRFKVVAKECLNKLDLPALNEINEIMERFIKVSNLIFYEKNT